MRGLFENIHDIFLDRPDPDNLLYAFHQSHIATRNGSQRQGNDKQAMASVAPALVHLCLTRFILSVVGFVSIGREMSQPRYLPKG